MKRLYSWLVILLATLATPVPTTLIPATPAAISQPEKQHPAVAPSDDPDTDDTGQTDELTDDAPQDEDEDLSDEDDTPIDDTDESDDDLTSDHADDPQTPDADASDEPDSIDELESDDGDSGDDDEEVSQTQEPELSSNAPAEGDDEHIQDQAPEHEDTAEAQEDVDPEGDDDQEDYDTPGDESDEVDPAQNEAPDVDEEHPVQDAQISEEAEDEEELEAQAGDENFDDSEDDEAVVAQDGHDGATQEDGETESDEYEEFEEEDEAVAAGDDDASADQEDASADDQEFESDEESDQAYEEGSEEEDGEFEDDAADEGGDEYEDGDEEEAEGGGEYNPEEGVLITLPSFGPVAFAPSPEARKAGELSAQAQQFATQADAQKKVSLTIFALQISDMTAYVDNDGYLFLEGRVAIGKKNGVLKLDQYTPEETIFTITFADGIGFPVLPGKKLTFKTFTYTITPEEQDLTVPASIFTQDKEETTLVFPLTPDKPEAHAQCDQILASQLMPMASNEGIFSNITLTNVDISFPSPFFPQSSESQVVVQADANLEKVKIGQAIKLSNSACTIELSPEEMVFTSEHEEPITVAGIDLHKPTVELVNAPGSPTEILIEGKAQVKLPLLGTLNMPIKLHRTEDGVEMRGKIEKEIAFGPVKFGHPEYVYQIKDVDREDTGMEATFNIQSIQGEAKLFGMTIIPKLTFVTTKTAGSKKKNIKFTATFKGMKDIRPFKMIPGLKEIPELSDMLLRQAHIGFDKAKKMFLGGKAIIKGIETKTKIVMAKAGVAIEAALKGKWRPSDTVKALKDTILDSFGLENVQFYFSTLRYFNHDINQRIDKGFNIFATIDLRTENETLKSIRKILGPLPPKLITKIVLSPNIRNCRFMAMVPLDVKLSDSASLHNVALEISGQPSIALLVAIKFIPEQGAAPLIFTGRLEIALTGATIAATMEGFWMNALGFEGLAIGDLALEVELGFMPPIPKSFGVAGTVLLGDEYFKVAVKLGFSDIIILVEISRLDMKQLMKILKDWGVDLEGAGFGDSGIVLEDFKFKFAPTGGQIGELYFDPGISAQGKLKISSGDFNAEAEAYFNIGMGGFKLFGRLSPIKIGPFKLTGKGLDKQYGTDDDGAIIYAALSLQEQRFYLSARAEVGEDMIGEAELDISPAGFRAYMLLDVLKTFKVELEAESYKKSDESGFRGMGVAKLGNSELKVVTNASNKEVFLGGTLNSLTLKDLATIANDAGAGIPAEDVPDFGLKDCAMYARINL